MPLSLKLDNHLKINKISSYGLVIKLILKTL